MNRMTYWLIVIICISAVGCASNANLVKIQSRPGVTQGFIHIMPESPPVASVILYAGGGGNLRLTGPTAMHWGEGNFLVRSRYKFAQQGFQVAVIDTPKDQWGHMPMNRSSPTHVADSRAVAAYLKARANVPVWIVGTSRGSDSVANLAINGGDAFSGAVFTSSVQDTAYYELGKITIPALVVHNKKDGCSVSSPSVAESIYRKLIQSENRQILWFSSYRRQSAHCNAKSPHGFLGIESEIVKAISTFIVSN